MIARAKPKQRRGKPEPLQARVIICDLCQVIAGGKNAVRTDQPFDLKNERVESGKINQAKSTKKNPAWQQLRPRTFNWSLRSQQPFRGLLNASEHVSPWVDYSFQARGHMDVP